MQRYFIEELNNDFFYLLEDDIHHLKHVMRNKNGDQIQCVASNQKVYLCEIEEIETGKIKVLKELNMDNELGVSVTLAYALPKGDKFEFVLQKACELGVDAIIPLMTNRSVVKTTPSKFEKKYERFNKILKGASKQSFRNKIPSIYPLMTILDLSQYMCDYNLVAYEENAKNNEMTVLKETLSKVQKGDSILIVVGPEGGFDTIEIEEMVNMGIKPCSLGKRILRSETAPLYMLSAISYALELK